MSVFQEEREQKRRQLGGRRTVAEKIAIVATLAAVGCGDSTAARVDAPPAAPTGTNMALPGIGLEVEDGVAFRGVYDAATRKVTVRRILSAHSLYESEPVPGTSVSGFAVTVDIGLKMRTLELITGPWEASFDKQVEVLGWVSQFYQSILAVAAVADRIDRVAIEGEDTFNTRDASCAEISRVVEHFETHSGVQMKRSSRARWEGEEVFLCLLPAREFHPQANYGVKLTAFADGAIARDFQGRPGRTSPQADGSERLDGPGCALTEERVGALRSATQRSVVPPDATAFCHQGLRDEGTRFRQPQFPCFPGCLMGQLCYGVGTNRIWYDGRAQTAEAVLCDPSAPGECRDAAAYNYASGLPLGYGTAASEAGVQGWDPEETAALRSLLIVNRCAAWVNSLSTKGVPKPLVRSFWKKQVMGALPKARLDQFTPHLPAAFTGYSGGTQDPPLTTLNAYAIQACEIPMTLGSTARQNCKAYVGAKGLNGFMGGNMVDLFRIDGDLALVVESRFGGLYVAGGYLGVRHDDGTLSYSAEALKESINFVRGINGFDEE